MDHDQPAPAASPSATDATAWGTALLTLERLTRAVEALQQHVAPRPVEALELEPIGSNAYAWHPDSQTLKPIAKVARIPFSLLVGIDATLDQLRENTRRFAQGLPANNVLLWGARGTGKSSSVKAVHREIMDTAPDLMLVELQRDDLQSLPILLEGLARLPQRFILFCDDLSFEHEDVTYKALKAVLDGGLAGRPENVVFYATSNRRHLMSRSMIENEARAGIHPREAEEEKVSLSDRFGLWLGFHRCDQATYLAMIQRYADYFELAADFETMRPAALEWATTRGARSGRVAWQFIQDWAGKEGKKIAVK